MKKFAILFASIVMVLGMSTSAMATPTYAGIFTMIGANNAIMTNSSGNYQHTPVTANMASTISLSSIAIGAVAGTMNIDPFPFFGLMAYAHGPAGPTAPFDVIKVGPNAYAAHMLFDWGVSASIDVWTYWHKGWNDAPSSWQAGGTAPVGGWTDTNDWQFAMDDSAWTGTNNSGTDGISGHRMWNGPFAGSYANFDFVKVIPEPTSLILIGSGLVGLLGIARKRK